MILYLYFLIFSECQTQSDSRLKQFWFLRGTCNSKICLKLTTELLSWEDAKTKCEKDGMTLIIKEDKKDIEEIVLKLINNNVCGICRPFISWIDYGLDIGIIKRTNECSICLWRICKLFLCKDICKVWRMGHISYLKHILPAARMSPTP